MKPKVLMAMSGGVDSSVAAILLREQGYELIGVTFRTFDTISKGCMEKEEGCCSVDSIFEAKHLADSLGFEHRILDIRDTFKETVIRNFIDEYLSGHTPNPCVVCNAVIKWGKLLELADELGCDFIATGHYARIGNLNGRYFLQKGVDTAKDQSYFLWRVGSDKLQRTLFPLGGLTKSEVRDIALRHGFEKLAHKGESQEICFIPGNDYRSFLEQHVPDFSSHYGAGEFVDTQGRVLGTHQGFPRYTIGQRKGLGIALGQPMFVVAIHPDDNRVVLGTKEEIRGHTCHISDVCLTKYDHIQEGMEVTAKIRYRNRGWKATLHPDSYGIRINFLNDVDSITPGQSAVLYEGVDVVGGGVID